MRFEIAASTTAVELWTERRMPFAPKSTALNSREELRRALRAMQPSDALTAEYTSDGLGLCDVENVLHYNVGSPWLSHLCARRISLERLFTAPPPAPSATRFRHHVRYRLGEHSSVTWKPGELVAERRFVLSTRDPIDLLHVWLAARRAAVSRAGPLPRTLAWLEQQRLVLSIALDLSDAPRAHLSPLLKPLIDGVMASLHRHDGHDTDELASRLASRLTIEITDAETRELLTAPLAEMAERRLLWRRDSGVQWNPADDGLVLIEATASRDARVPSASSPAAPAAPAAPEQHIQVHARLHLAVAH